MRAVVCIAALALLVGCDSTSEVESVCRSRPLEGALQPLRVGNRWDYEAVWPDGRITSQLRHEVTDRLDDRFEEGNPIYVLAVYPVDRPDAANYDLVANTSTGYRQVGHIDDADTVFVDLVEYPYPAEIGRLFGDTPQFEVVSTDHETALPIGAFTTVVYERKEYWIDDFPSARSYLQFAPGVGLVAQDVDVLASADGPRPSPQIRLTDWCLMQ